MFGTGRAHPPAFRALLNLEEPKHSIEQIAAKTGKSPVYCAQRIKLTELSPAAVEAFYKDEIGVGHALLLAKLQPAEQEQALAACFREDCLVLDVAAFVHATSTRTGDKGKKAVQS